MQIFEASQEYAYLVNGSSEVVWYVCKIRDGALYKGYFVLKTNLGRQLTRSVNSRTDGAITLQRGGVRVFKTLDAAANAIKQIGQDSFEVTL